MESEQSSTSTSKPKGVEVRLYFKEGAFYQEVNGKLVQLHCWVGVQLEAWIEKPPSWYRADINHYEPNSLMAWLHRKESQEEYEGK